MSTAALYITAPNKKQFDYPSTEEQIVEYSYNAILQRSGFQERNSAPQPTLTMFGDIFDCHNKSGVAHRHLMGRGQGCS